MLNSQTVNHTNLVRTALILGGGGGECAAPHPDLHRSPFVPASGKVALLQHYMQAYPVKAYHTVTIIRFLAYIVLLTIAYYHNLREV